MELLSVTPGGSDRYLKKYTLTYRNKTGKEKHYELVSRHAITCPEDLGSSISGFSIVAVCGERMVLLKEFRMAVNAWVYNLIAGMLEEGETPEDCIRREVAEETGLHVVSIDRILPPSYSAVAISDIRTSIAFVTVEGEISSEGQSENEDIRAAFYTKQQVEELLEEDCFSSRSQLAALLFTLTH